MITIEVQHRNLKFSKEERNLATGANTRDALRDRFEQVLAAKTQFTVANTISVDESVLKRMVSKYSEQFDLSTA
jgi:uncharacterized NAD-dependent epimerase/dehydratase family protein